MITGSYYDRSFLKLSRKKLIKAFLSEGLAVRRTTKVREDVRERTQEMLM